MEAHNENENALLAILKAKQNHEEYDESKLLQLLQQIHSSNQSQISQLQREIDNIENINRLCNLTLQIKMLQYMRQNSPNNPLFSNLLNSWSTNTIPQWAKISQNLNQELAKTNISQINTLQVNNLIAELVGTIAESMHKVDTESPQKFISSQVLPLFYSGHSKRKGTEVENDLEIVQMDTTQVLGEEEGQTIDDFIQSLLTIQENIENGMAGKLLDLACGDLDKEDQILNTIYLTLSISQFEEKFQETQNKRTEKRSAKLKVSYDSDEAFLTELENSLKELKDDFNHFLQHIQLSRDYFPIHLQERIGNSYSPFITELLLKHLTKMDYPNLIKLTTKLYGFYESLLDGILNTCEPGSLAETRTLQEILEAPVTEHLSLVTPNILVYLQSDSQIYIAQASQRLQATLQERIKFFEANQSLQDDTKLKNIDLDPKAANFLNEYNLAEEIAGSMNQDNQTLIQHINEDINLVQSVPVKPKNTEQFLTVSRALLNNNDSPQKPQGGFSLDVAPLIGSNNQEPDPQNVPDSSNNIPFFELTRYSASASIPLSELIRSPEYMSQVLDKHGLEILRELGDLNLIKDFQPARISKTLLKYLNDIDSFPEILVKFQKLTGGQKNYLDVFVEVLIRTTNKLQRKLEVYFELDRPDCLLYLSDWSFLNYRIIQLISIANLLEPKGEAFSDEDISTFKERFSQAGSFNLKYLEKRYLEKYSLLVYSAIENEEWRSYRPFVSSEIDEVFLRKEVTKMSKLSSLIQKSHIKSINYGLRMWKLLLKRNIGELTSYFGYPKTNLYGIKAICTLVTETVSAIYLKYKAIEPSRTRNPQYVNDLKFFVDCAEQQMRIIFGMVLIRLSHESPDDRKTMTSLKYFLTGSLNSLWWNIKSAKCFLALLDVRPEILADFLKECNNDQVPLAIYPENHLNEMVKMSQYLYTEAVSLNRSEMKESKASLEKIIQEGGDVSLLKNIQGKLQAMLDRLAILAQCKNELTLSQLYEKFDLKMETLSSIELQNVEGGIEENMPKNINTATSKGFRDSTQQGFSNKQREEVLDLEEAIKELFVSNANPMIKYGQSLFLSGNDVVSSEVMKNILGTMIFSPEHILFIIRKRIEYTFDEFPLLTEENKQAQRILNPLLEEFCQKFKIKMFDIPSS